MAKPKSPRRATEAKAKTKKAKPTAKKVGSKRQAPKVGAARKTAAKPPKKTAKQASTARYKPRRNPETLRLRSFMPSLTVSDLTRSIAFYTDVLGWFVGERWPGPDGQLRGVMLKAGTCELGLAQDDWALGRDRRLGQGVRLWCETEQNVDALAARIKASGRALTEEPTDQTWGARSLSVDDPDGYHLSIYHAR
jgi:catechol 2,3-dioxygenase-like lactoylglutathione lyase family enzyme